MWIRIFLTFTIIFTVNDSFSGGRVNAISRNSSGRAITVIPGDFIIGLFVSVHHQPKNKKAHPSDFLKCGEIREHYGIQRTEIALKTIDEINADELLLPNITLGIEIRDSCWYAPIALQQSIEMIKDTISPKTKQSDSCPIDLDKEESKEYQTANGQLIGVVGPGSSSVALQVQNLLQLFSIPQIGYSTTSKDLSDKARFSTFMRVVPSDYYQAQVMVDIVKKFNWNYVSIVNTDENYGQSGIQAFRELAEKNGVCIAEDSSILSNDDDEKFNGVLEKLEKDDKAKVVVCFCEGMTIRGLLKAFRRRNSTSGFLLIGTDGWADRTDVVEGYEKEALGSISIRVHSPRVDSFDSYYFSLNPENNTRNPWFNEFWMYKFNCTLRPDEDLANETNSGNSLETPDGEKKYCTGDEKLSYDNYHQEPKLSFVIKAIYTIAYGLQMLQEEKCGKTAIGKCSEMNTFNGTHFFEILKRVNFTYPPGGNDSVYFDSVGDPPGRYDIINYQHINGTYTYVQVGEWKNGTLKLTTPIMNETMQITSVCSKPCPPGQFKQHQTGGQDKKCCWNCARCPPNTFLLNDTYCEKCRKGKRANGNKTGCVPLLEDYLRWDDLEAIISICFAVFGFIATLIVLLIFVKNNNTPVVKASTRELCYLILFGMMLSHFSILFFIAEPNQISCALNRIVPWISFSMIYASLLVKTNRIARILAGSKKRFPTRKPRFMSAGAQLFLTSVLIMIAAGIAIIMVINEPANSKLIFPDQDTPLSEKDKIIIKCNTTGTGVLSPLAFIFFLIGMCTLYALKTRNVPENFNEAKFIGFAMYTTCVIWIAFVPIYFGSDSQIITMCVCITLSAMVTLSFLFLPKLYIIILHPEKNIRALFTTSKSIRCHIGSRVASAILQKTPSSLSSTVPGYFFDDHDNDIRIQQSKPLHRSSSCQTSLELLHKYMDKKIELPPSLAWSELNIKELNDNQNNVMLGNSPKRDPTPVMGPTQKKCSVGNKIYDNSYAKLNKLIAKTKSNDKLLDDNINKVTILKSTARGNKKSYLDTVRYRSNSTSPSPGNIIRKNSNQKLLCVQCQELENSSRKEHNHNHNNLNNNKTPIYTIDHQTPASNKLIRATISEESLSECSISESCDCKLKSITIRLGSPNSNVKI